MKYYVLFAAAVLLFGFVAHAETSDFVYFNTEAEAATAALTVISKKPTGHMYEWGGQIIKTSGGYVALPPRTDFAGDHVMTEGAAQFIIMLTGGVVTAGYHTHPCIARHAVDFFSPEDMLGAVTERHTEYMGNMCTGRVQRFLPTDKIDVEHPSFRGRKGVDDTIWMSRGTDVGVFTAPSELLPE